MSRVHRETRAAKLDTLFLAGGALAITAVAFLLDADLPPGVAWIGPAAAFGGFAAFSLRLLLHLHPLGEAVARRLPAAVETVLALAAAVGGLALARAVPGLAAPVVAGGLLVAAGMLAVCLALALGGTRFRSLAMLAVLVGAVGLAVVRLDAVLLPLALVLAGLVAMLLAKDATLPLARGAAADLFVAGAFGAFVLAQHDGGLPSVVASMPGVALAAAALVGVALALPALFGTRAPGAAGSAPWLGVAALLGLAAVTDAFGPSHLLTRIFAMGGAAAMALRVVVALRPIAAVVERSRGIGRWLVGALEAALLLYPVSALLLVVAPATQGITVPLALALLPLVSPFALVAAAGFPLLLLFVGYLSAEGLDELAEKAPAPLPRPRVAAALVAVVAGALAFAGLMALPWIVQQKDAPMVYALGYGAIGLAVGAVVAGALAARGKPDAGKRAATAAVLGFALAWYLGYATEVFEAYDTVPVITAVVVAWGVIDAAGDLPERLAGGKVLRPYAGWSLLLLFAFLVPLALLLVPDGLRGVLTSADAWWVAGIALGAVLLVGRRALRAMRP